jgi:hypothetical protein
MPEYRVYFVGADDHFHGAETVNCTSDKEAVTTALEWIGGFPAVEVWCGTRPIGKLVPDNPPQP